jgi:hypothetical protein
VSFFARWMPGPLFDPLRLKVLGLPTSFGARGVHPHPNRLVRISECYSPLRF